MKDLASDVVDLLDKLEWTEDRSIHIVGHSMGGMMAQEIVRQVSRFKLQLLTLVP